MKRLVLSLLFVWPVCVSLKVPDNKMDLDFLLSSGPPPCFGMSLDHTLGQATLDQASNSCPDTEEKPPCRPKKRARTGEPASLPPSPKPRRRHSSSFLKYWISNQYVYNDVPSLKPASFCTEELNRRIYLVDDLHQPFVSKLWGKRFFLDQETFPSTATLDQLFASLCNHKYEFVRLLNQLSFNAPELEEKYDAKEETSQYVNLAGIFCPCSNLLERDQFNFNLANYFFEYLFFWDGRSQNPIFRDEKNYPILRFMYSVIYEFLIDRGWIHWSHEIIKKLKAKAQKGLPITYIAGGCDIYQLVKNGIYNITIIDPFLPSQEKLYYVKNALWFVEGNVDDELVFDDIERSKVITMRRDFCAFYNEVFSIKTSKDRTIRIPRTTTVWGLYNHRNKRIGAITFERRLCTQADFNNPVVLMSLNEAVLAFSSPSFYGWGMQTCQLPSNFRLHIKQLHNTIKRRELQNYCDIDDSNHQFKFIHLCTPGD